MCKIVFLYRKYGIILIIIVVIIISVVVIITVVSFISLTYCFTLKGGSVTDNRTICFQSANKNPCARF